MPTNKKILSQDAVSTGDPDSEQSLVLYLDANDEDSIESGGANTGAGSGTWFDIANHDLNVPLTDNNDNLEIHIDASNTNSYGGSGSTITDISTNGYSFSTHGNAAFGSDLRGYFTLDGSDDDLRTTDAVTGFSGDVTFEWWFNASESNNFALLHANPASNDSGINGIFIGNAAGSAGAIEIYRKTTGGTTHSGQSSSTGLSGMASDGWVHFVITITSANVCKFYKDGTYQGTLTLNGNGTNHDTYNFVSIGGYNNASYEFAGKMGCFRMYSEILTASDIGQNYRAGNLLSYSSIYDTNLNMNLDAATYTSGAWGDSVGSNDGTISGASFDKELGNYFDLDGSNDKITVAGADLNPANTKSIGVWFNTDSTSSEQYIISNWSGSGNNYGYHLIADSGTLKAWVYSQAQNAYFANLASGGTITAGKWHYAVLNIGPNASDNKLFLDGVLTETESSTSGTFPTTAAHNGITIGAYGAAVWFNGKIGQIKAYSTQLTSAQVAQNYLATKNNYPNGFNFSVDGPTFSTNSSPAYNYFRSDAAAEKLLLSSVDIDITMGYTISLYLRRHATTGTYQQQFRMTGDGFTSYLFLIAGYGDVRYFSSSGTGTAWSTYGSSGDWTTDWINVIHVREANGAGTTNNRGEIYINGVSHATNNSLTAATNITRIGFGDNINTSRVDNVDSGAIKLWQKPFSDAEALAEFNATKSTYGL